MRDVAPCDFPPKNLYFPLLQESMGTTFRYLESSYGRTYADVITKISRMDSLPNYLSYSAPLACASRAQGAPLRIVQRQQGPVVWELTSRAGGNHSVGSNLGVVIYLLRFLYTFFLFIYFLTYLCPLACFPVFSLRTISSFARFLLKYGNPSCDSYASKG